MWVIMKSLCCQVNRHWASLFRFPFNLRLKSPITVNLDWVKEETTTWIICGCGKPPLITLKNDEAPAVRRVKRGPSLREKYIHHNDWLVRHDSLLLFHVAANLLSSAPHHISVTHGLPNLEATLDNLTSGDEIFKLSGHLQLSEEENK